MGLYSKVEKKESEEVEILIDMNDLYSTGGIAKTFYDTDVDEDMAKDLAHFVGDAIAIWAKKYQLDNVPSDIILEQAISILLIMHDLMK